MLEENETKKKTALLAFVICAIVLFHLHSGRLKINGPQMNDIAQQEIVRDRANKKW